MDEIKRTAVKNGGVPLGRSRFQKETGINEYNIRKYWPTLGDAQREAGFTPNTLQSAHDKDLLIVSLISLIREINKFPTVANLTMKRNQDLSFPSPETFRRLGNKRTMAEKVLEYARQKSYNDIISICEPLVLVDIDEKEVEDSNNIQQVGEVYLFKSGKYYKIGKTSDTVRRGSEIRIQLPEDLNLIHSIKTDDPSGVEAYWHRRFDSRRMNGEWFDLSSNDVKAFKTWKRIV